MDGRYIDADYQRKFQKDASPIQHNVRSEINLSHSLISFSKKEKNIFRCDSPVEMQGLSFAEIHDKKYHMRCEDYYGRRPERDGPVLVGIFIGE